MKKRILLFICIVCAIFFASCNNDVAETTSRGILYEDIIEPLAIPGWPEKEVRIRFVATGDNIAHDSVVNTAREDADSGKEYDFTKIYAGIADVVKSADIAFVNQEAPVGGKELGISGYPNFNAPDEMVYDLISIGFDVFNIANNHMLDKGEKGYSNTIDFFNSLPITMIGGYTKDDYDNVRIVEKNGVKIAFLSYTTILNYAHKDKLTSGKYIIPYADVEDITRQVNSAKNKADVVIASFHWGTEDEFGITSEQKKYAKLCADLGVNVLLGHHSHVVGEVEYLSGVNGNKMLVAYSLGNLCSTMMYGRNMVGELLSFDIIRGENGDIRVENAIVDPVICHYKRDTESYDVRVYMFKDYTSELSDVHGAHVWGDKFSFADLKKIVTNTVSGEFLPDYIK